MAERLLALVVATAALCVPALARAQQVPRLVIEHADQIQRLAQGDSISYYLDGGVRARRGDLRLTAQHVVVLEWLGLVDASRDVHLWDAEKELYADHVLYTDSIDQAVASGNVQVIDRKSGSQLKSQQAVYDRPAGLLTATQSPEMILLPEPEEGAEPDSASEPLHVWSEQVRLVGGTDEVVATRNVLIRRGESLTAKADSVRFAGAEERLALRNQPRVETDRFYVEAEEIDVQIAEGRVRALIARGGARAASSADSVPAKALEALGRPSPSSWIAGDTLRFLFAADALQRLEATGTARSLNYALESERGDAATWALSYVLAGRIVLVFDVAGEGVARVEASQDSRGVYRTVAITLEEGEEAVGTEDTTGTEAAPPAPPAASAPADTLGAGETPARTPADSLVSPARSGEAPEVVSP